MKDLFSGMPPQRMPFQEPFRCPHHDSLTDGGWCWECAEETYGYEKAKEVFEQLRHPTEA